MCALASHILKRGASIVRRLAQGERDSDGQERGWLSEEEFVRLLCFERKRSERSERPFLLMLIDGHGLFGTDGSGSVREQVAATLLAKTRDTDVLGWYKDNATMAVLFTELCDPPNGAIEVISTKVASAIRQQLQEEQAKQIEISVHLFPEPAEKKGPGSSSDLTLYPDLMHSSESRKVTRGIKRMVDIAGSLIALVLFSPLLLAIALAIKLTSKGPVLFRQSRVGQYSREFTFLKFRSMYVDCDPNIHKQYVTKLIAGGEDTGHSTENGDAVYKIKDDPRVTRVGNFLRKTSLDELPQFINVLKGEMSLVGPRPPLPYELERYEPWHRRRVLEARPGITGYWQVHGRSRTTFDEMVRMDLKYVEQASLLLDLKIILQTPRAVLSGNGAY